MTDAVRDALAEILELCAIGDVDECTEALGWGKAIQRARAALSEARAVPEWRCACDEQGRGEPGVTCGDWQEAQRNHAEDAYFAPRPVQDGAMSRKAFCDGFDRGWRAALQGEHHDQSR